MTRASSVPEPASLRRSLVPVLCFAAILWIFPGLAAAAEIIFLQNGKTIQAEKSEIIFDQIRITTATEIIQLPRNAVLSIHQVDPPAPAPASPLPGEGIQSVPPQPSSNPADAYRGITQQMTDQVRRANQEQLDRSRTK